MELRKDLFIPRLTYAKASAAAVPPSPNDSTHKDFPSKSPVRNLDYHDSQFLTKTLSNQKFLFFPISSGNLNY